MLAFLSAYQGSPASAQSTEPGSAKARTPAPGTAPTLADVVVCLCPYPGDRAMWDYICGRDDAFELSRGLRGLVLPHHFSDQFELAAAWRAAAAAVDPPLVVILSPDHFLAGPTEACLPDGARFSTVYGDVLVDRPLSAALARLDPESRALADQPFRDEHGVGAHTAFIRRYFPGAAILPILLKPGMGADRLDRLVRDLVDLAPPGTLFVASVDASHYNPASISRFHDRMTTAALEAMDGPRLLGAEVDSPESLYALNGVMRGLGVSTARVFHRTDLQDRFVYPIADNTSHLYVRYGLGPGADADPTRALTVLALPFGGDGPGMPPGVTRSWAWDWRDPDRTSRLFPRLAALAGRGEEDRRFTGSDIYVFGALEAPGYRWVIGGERVALIRFRVGDGARADDWAQGLAEERAWADCLIAVIDVDPSDGASARDPGFLSSSAVAAGVDLAIVRSPRSGAYTVFLQGATTVVVLPGSLFPSGDGGDGPGVALAATRASLGWELVPLALSWTNGQPGFACVPQAKSYDPPPVYAERE